MQSPPSTEQRSAKGEESSSLLLRPLVDDVFALAGENSPDACITCVESFEENLYVGTSTGQVLHLVSIPAASPSSQTCYIFASKLQPSGGARENVGASNGVTQILPLPREQKVCILSNEILSFYTLPELSPAFGGTVVANCTFVGGVDDDPAAEIAPVEGTDVMICVKNRIRLVRISDGVQRLRDLQFAGCIAAARHGAFACVADAQSYALLDVEQQQKISLFPVSTMTEIEIAGNNESIGDVARLAVASSAGSGTRSPSDAVKPQFERSHVRSTSMGHLVRGLTRSSSPRPKSLVLSSTTPDLASIADKDLLTSKEGSIEKPLPAAPIPPRSDSLGQRGLKPKELLLPSICVAGKEEFILTTGSSQHEPGVGIFVNLDGDVVRGSLEFERYPDVVVVCPKKAVSDAFPEEDDTESSLICYIMSRRDEDTTEYYLKMQALSGRMLFETKIPVRDQDTNTSTSTNSHRRKAPGLRVLNTDMQISYPIIGERLCLRPRDLTSRSEAVGKSALDDHDQQRQTQERTFSDNLGSTKSGLIVWTRSSLYMLSPQPWLLTVESKLQQSYSLTAHELTLTLGSILSLLKTIQEKTITSETDFLSSNYLRQAIILLVFARILTAGPSVESDLENYEYWTQIGLDSGLDPRIIISLVPLLRTNTPKSPNSVWIHTALHDLLDRMGLYLAHHPILLQDSNSRYLLRFYLSSWRQRKDYGSIVDKDDVFPILDIAYLQLLLHEYETIGITKLPSSIRAELYALVDTGLDAFDEAAQMLEDHKFLYVLSRLYQSRRMARKVLQIWRRIIEGDEDVGGGLTDGEQEIRRYLINIKDRGLVQEYGGWLARRNPGLGVQVFLDKKARVQWTTDEVVQLLHQDAPNAIKEFYEYLVFGKKQYRFTTDLINHYLDSVLLALQTSAVNRTLLAQTYELYRALEMPKPTYREYLAENAVSQQWWQDRLRLLELLGGVHGVGFQYDPAQIIRRIGSFKDDLVPESIVLYGQQGLHHEALRLLTHSLGDYHTAVNYCLLEGSSIFHPTHGVSSTPITSPSQIQSRASPPDMKPEEHSHSTETTLQIQRKLFAHLLSEFLMIQDEPIRKECTSELLARYSSFFEIRAVLAQIPSSWSLATIADYLINSLRDMLHEKTEAAIVKAMSGAENLQVAYALAEKCTAGGAQIIEKVEEQV